MGSEMCIRDRLKNGHTCALLNELTNEKGSTGLDWTRAKPTIDRNSFPLSRARTIGFAKTIPSGIWVQEYAPEKY